MKKEQAEGRVRLLIFLVRAASRTDMPASPLDAAGLLWKPFSEDLREARTSR